MGNKHITILATGFLLLMGCTTEESSHDQKINIESVTIDISKNVKTLLIIRNFYVGTYGPDGWVGWQKYGYRLTVPLGRFRNVINPDINGTDADDSCVYGYVTFNEEKHEIFIKCREIEFPSGYVYDEAHGGNARSVEVIGDNEIPINGVLQTDNPDAYR